MSNVLEDQKIKQNRMTKYGSKSRSLGTIWIFFFHHLSLKIPQFSIPTRLVHFTHLLITQFFYFFVRPTPIKWLDPSVNKISFNHKTKIVTTTIATTITVAKKTHLSQNTSPNPQKFQKLPRLV